jgi:hypothetical protein
MRLTTALILAAAFMVACGGKSDTSTLSGSTYGGDFTFDETMTLTEAIAAYDDLQGQEICLDGTIEAMCLHKGDWLVWSEGVNQVIVQFKDHAYTIPTDSQDKRVLVQGFLRSKPLPANCDNAENEQQQAHKSEMAAVHGEDENGEQQADHAENDTEEDTDQADNDAAEEETAEEEVNRVFFLATSVKIID